MKKKMSFSDLKALFNDPTVVMADTLDSNVISGATRHGHKHVHKPARRPSVGKITPALYRRRHLGRKK